MMQMPPVKYDAFPLAGGLDQTTPTLSLPPGFARRAVNFECSINGGYSRIAGYERFDGHARPSDAFYMSMTCAITGSIVVGNTVTGGTSAATGKVIAVSGNDVIITRQVGSFIVGETLKVAAVDQATISSLTGVVSDGYLDATYLNLAADEYRASISAIPGSGSVLGVCYYRDKVYAFRNNIGGTEALMYVSSPTGWTQINFGEEIKFTNANTSVEEGDILTQGGVTATVARLVIETGTLLSGVNTGRMILTGRSGGNYVAGAATTTGAGAVTLSGAQTSITLNPNGKYRMVVANFGASSASQSIYGCDGQNRAFEFDGTNYVPIATGMTVDRPNHIAAHKQHLFLAYGYSLQFSSIGSPFSWSVVVGAGEIGMLDDITNLLVMTGSNTDGALFVSTKNDISVLYGTDSTTFNLAVFNSGAGAQPDTTQNLEQAYLLNDFGISTLATSKNFGNFDAAALTQNIRPFLSSRTVLSTASAVQRAKGQYRVYFSDGTGLYMTMKNGQLMGAMPVEYTNPVTCSCEGEDENGRSAQYFGSTNGVVYQCDVGTSFDGSEINASLQLVFNSTHSHRMLKRYRKASLELSGGSYISFDVGYALAYSSADVGQPENVSYSQFLRSSYWDEFVWDNFVWDGTEITPGEIDVCGTAENISIRVSSLSDFMQPFTINTITTHYTPRRGIR